MIAVVPFLLLAVLVAAQFALAGQALWSAGVAARAGARARLVGGAAAPAARAALPASMRAGAHIEGTGISGQATNGPVSVRVAVPRLVPGLPSISVTASAGLGSARMPNAPTTGTAGASATRPVTGSGDG